MPASIVENIDCMEAMRQFPDKFFDLAIIDPPYGIGEDGASNHSRGSKNLRPLTARLKRNTTGIGIPPTMFTPKEWDRDPPPKEYFIELQRVSKNQIIFGANHFIENIPHANSSCWIVWDKNNGKTNFADCELAWASFKTAVRQFTFTWNGLLQGDMRNREQRIHPTQKPVKLYEWLLQKYAQPGWKILDTHLGSGSSRIAAHNLGFDFWGYEIDAEYFEKHTKRFNTEAALFGI